MPNAQAAPSAMVMLAIHIADTIRQFAPQDRYDVASELIDKAERRGRIDATQAATLRERLLGL